MGLVVRAIWGHLVNLLSQLSLQEGVAEDLQYAVKGGLRMYVCLYVYIYVYVYMNTHTCTYICMYIYIYTHLHIHIHI